MAVTAAAPPAPAHSAQDGPGVFCSPQCADSPLPCRKPCSACSDDDDVIIHHVRWTGNDTAGILAWAADIEPTSPALPAPPVPPSASPSRTPSQALHIPKLMLLGRRPAPPALSVTAPSTVVPPPSKPLNTALTRTEVCSSLSLQSLGKNSIASAPTDSSLATPPNLPSFPAKQSLLGSLATHVRSWVAPSPLDHDFHTKHLDHFTVLATSHHPPHSDSPWRISSTILVAQPRPPRGRSLRPSRT
ncbi:hypothetical protein H0H87_009116 [Tephrocybe sp. NHM501043]|nr:hypothetical protein H0H87_009116 [Tephrocybe sp. NHM501043]